jgi:hypothetical protein
MTYTISLWGTTYQEHGVYPSCPKISRVPRANKLHDIHTEKKHPLWRTWDNPKGLSNVDDKGCPLASNFTYTYGLCSRSNPIVVRGPCPGYTVTSSSNSNSLPWMESSRVFSSPPDKSVLPTESLNNTSPPNR